MSRVLARSALAAALAGCASPPEHAEVSPAVPEVRTAEIRVTPPGDDWRLGRVSWVASDRSGLVYLLQRGDSADPIVVVDRTGRIIRSFGKGLYRLPHSIRLDRQGNVWTTDAYTSDIRKFSSDGRLLMTIAGDPPPAECTSRNRVTCGTSDIAISPNGHIFAADGYWNARIIEYAADGRKVREWGSKGSGPGEMNLPHSIVIDDRGIVYVADRDNNRIQRFTSEGRWIDAWPLNGQPFSLELAGRTLWIGVAQRSPSNTLQPTLVRADASTGRVLWQVPVTGGHGMSTLAGGDTLLVDVQRTAHMVLFGPPIPKRD